MTATNPPREPREPDSQRLLAMARVLDRTGRRVSALEDQIRHLATDLTRIAGVLAARDTTPTPTPPAAAPAGTPGGTTLGSTAATADMAAGTPAAPRSWLLSAGTENQDLPAALHELIAWVDLVYLRFPDALLAGCWLWHPSVIEELWWLRGAHADAYDPDTGSWLRVGDWHDRQRPGVTRRVRDVLAKCDLSLHTSSRTERSPATEAPPAPMAGHATAIAVEWGRSGTRRAPSQDQLDEARALAATQIRGRR